MSPIPFFLFVGIKKADMWSSAIVLSFEHMTMIDDSIDAFTLHVCNHSLVSYLLALTVPSFLLLFAS